MEIYQMHKRMNDLFRLFNTRFYQDALPMPVIAIQSNGNNARSKGWCTFGKIWKDHETGKFYYEIAICSEYLYRPAAEICATLLHEMVHLYCNVNFIKETSRTGAYHNKTFREIAEQHGLSISYDKRVGWSITELQPDTRTFIKNHVPESLFSLTRRKHHAGDENTAAAASAGKASRKSSSRKYTCPQCGTTIRATKDVSLICGVCLCRFVKEVSE